MFSFSQYKWCGETILVAEHDKFTFDLLRRIFHVTGVNIIEVTSHEELTNTLKNNNAINIVLISDFFLTEKTEELIINLCMSNKEVVFFICSTNPYMSTRLSIGCTQTEIVYKPYSPRMLMHMIDVKLKEKVKL